MPQPCQDPNLFYILATLDEGPVTQLLSPACPHPPTIPNLILPTSLLCMRTSPCLRDFFVRGLLCQFCCSALLFPGVVWITTNSTLASPASIRFQGSNFHFVLSHSLVPHRPSLIRAYKSHVLLIPCFYLHRIYLSFLIISSRLLSIFTAWSTRVKRNGIPVPILHTSPIHIWI